MVIADLVDRTKNVSGVIQALALARQEEPGMRLTIIGDGPDRSMLQELVAQHGLKGSVIFLGRLPNSGVLEQIAHAGAVIINSNVETFSVVTGEALAQGKPVIATRCGGPQGFVSPENGVLIEVGDTAALSTAMLHLKRQAATYDPAVIRRSVSDRFSPEAVGRAFVSVYERTSRDSK